jgi:hypothetical protein
MIFDEVTRARKLRALVFEALVEPELDALVLSSAVLALGHGLYGWLHDSQGRPYGSFRRFYKDQPPFGLGMSEKQISGIVYQAMSRQLEDLDERPLPWEYNYPDFPPLP